MPFLTKGKTNWKFVAIVIVLAVIVGGGVLFWVRTQEVHLVEFPEVEVPERVGEEAEEEIEEEITEDETVKCKFHTHEEIMKIAEGLFIETSQSSYDFLVSFFNNPVDSFLVSDDERLTEYLRENLTGRDPGQYKELPLKMISRGRFDKKYPDKEMVVISLETKPYRGLPYTRVIIFQEETKKDWCASYQAVERYPGSLGIELLEPKKLIKDEPEFFPSFWTKMGGTCVPFSVDFTLYKMENKTFVPVFETISRFDGGYTTVEWLSTTIDFKDLDGDDNLEIIKEGTRKICTGPLGACYATHCDEVIEEEEVYQIFKWDAQKQTFLEKNQ